MARLLYNRPDLPNSWKSGCCSSSNLMRAPDPKLMEFDSSLLSVAKSLQHRHNRSFNAPLERFHPDDNECHVARARLRVIGHWQVRSGLHGMAYCDAEI